MADGTIVEGIKLLGGVAGLATAAFTIWDRAFREQPQVWVVADPIFKAQCTMVVGPHWTAYAQAVGTPIIALVAGGIASGIAYRQWKVAKAKVVLDLFEKRLEVYNLVVSSINRLISEGSSNIDHNITQPFITGLLKSKFLFGKEVHEYLDEIYGTISTLRSNERNLRSNERLSDTEIRDNKLEELYAIEDSGFSKITSFQKTFDDMIYPYMRMDEKK